MIVECWDANPKSRPEFSKLAKQLEADLISIQVLPLAVFSYPGNTKNYHNTMGDHSNGEAITKTTPIQPATRVEPRTAHVGQFKEIHSKQMENTPKKRQILPNFQTMFNRKKITLVSIGFCIVVVIIIVVVTINYSTNSSSRNADTFNPTLTAQSSTLTTSASSGEISTPVPAYYVSTVAGTGIPGANNAKNDTATFNRPYGITKDSFGNLYVSDVWNNLIRKIDLAGMVSTFAGSGSMAFADGQNTSASFGFPHGITSDSANNMYVADLQNCRIRKITHAGVVSTYSGSRNCGSSDNSRLYATFACPQGVSIDNFGNLFVADTCNSKIRKIGTDDLVSTLSGGGFSGSVDTEGLPASYNFPNTVIVDSDGNLFVADTNNHQIKKITPSGLVTTIGGNGTAGFSDGVGNLTTFHSPLGLALDDSGNLYVGDSSNNRIRKISSSGLVTTIVGNGIASSSNGNGASATVNTPAGLFYDPAGYLYVAEFWGNKIRKIDLFST